MQTISTNMDGLFEIENKVFHDARGKFVKTFHNDTFVANNLDCDFKESFYSVSNKDVLRGMHFQKPPHDHAKLVYVVAGEILDVAVDIRNDSETFGCYYATNLSFDNAKSLYMSRGFAHGFLTLSDSATVVYMTTSVHSPDDDSGIKWDCFGFDWNGITNPIVSDRDSKFSGLEGLYGK